jgi:hypothetical protein
MPWRWLAALAVAVSAQLACFGQTTNVSVTPAADAFVRSLAPADNYGAAGALSVSGAAAVNGSGQTNGLFDTLIRFPMSNVVATAAGAFGTNNWVVTGAALNLNEVAAPNNPIFDRGVGAFEIRWITNDVWGEGTGKPITPTMDGVACQDLSSVLNPALDESLGSFTNSGLDGPVSFTLPLAGGLVSNVLAGVDINLYLTAASDSVGFTFNSKDFTGTNSWPVLTITAAAKPLVWITSIEGLGANQVTLRFNTASNWTYVLQGLDSLPARPAVGWFNLFLVAAQPLDGQSLFVDGVTNPQRFYRLRNYIAIRVSGQMRG